MDESLKKMRITPFFAVSMLAPASLLTRATISNKARLLERNPTNTQHKTTKTPPERNGDGPRQQPPKSQVGAKCRPSQASARDEENDQLALPTTEW